MKMIRKGLAVVAALAMTLTLAAPAQAAVADDTLRYEMVNALNDARNCSNTPLSLHTQAKYGAQAHANDMSSRDYFSHSTMSPYPYPYGGSDWWRRPAYWGVTSGYLGEIIAWGYSTVNGAVNAWLNSSDHRATLMDCSYRYVGVGWNSGDGNKWVVDFTGHQAL
jgi:uncharacterized protein YkwD